MHLTTVNKFCESVFNKNNIEDCTMEEINQLINTHPWFGAAHFLAANKQKTTTLKENAVIYSNFPLLVSYYLNTTVEIEPQPNHLLRKINFDSTINSQKLNDTLFQPFYTVDYFAAQGIKPILEENSKNRFNQQLKSFTDWLKTLKTLPDAEQPYQELKEKQIETMALHSIQDTDAITEAMAEIWIQQNENKKALKIYEQLSLQEPLKNAYFAKKIEHLLNK